MVLQKKLKRVLSILFLNLLFDFIGPGTSDQPITADDDEERTTEIIVTRTTGSGTITSNELRTIIAGLLVVYIIFSR